MSEAKVDRAMLWIWKGYIRTVFCGQKRRTVSSALAQVGRNNFLQNQFTYTKSMFLPLRWFLYITNIWFYER